MDLKDIRQMLKLMETHELSSFQLETGDFKVSFKRGEGAPGVSYLPAAAPAPAAAAPAASAPSAAASQPAASEGDAAEGTEINSPMVGTFYRAPSPEDAPFVEVGDTVREGQVICIIEAMKVMNEIKATASGVLSEVLVEDATAVQFGEALMRVK